MVGRLKKFWAEFRSVEPGRRFQERFERRRKKGSSPLARILRIGLGIVVFAAGIFFLPAPGPGTVVLVIGAGLIAQEWRAAAQALDWLDLRIRGLIGWGRGVWDRSGTAARVLIVLVALAAGAGVAYLAWRTFFGG